MPQDLLFVGTSAADMLRSANISDNGLFRWWLKRQWEPADWNARPKKTVTWIMLNPSKADDRQDDPTIRRCIGFSKAWGYGGLCVVNLYPLRSTDPKTMLAHPARTGDERGNHELKRCSREASLVVCAWGGNAEAHRVSEVVRLLDGVKLHCLDLTQGGQPVHPLRQRADLQPMLYQPRAE